AARAVMRILGDIPRGVDLAGRHARLRKQVQRRAWTAVRTVSAALDLLAQARVPAGKVYTARDIAEDPHYRARGMILSQETRDGYTLEVPGIVPKLSGTPGAVRSSAPGLGDDTDAVLRELGLSAQEIAALRARKVAG
ncbi:MAG: CoA transferase, partial [Noviherbaspirillum sp.]